MAEEMAPRRRVFHGVKSRPQLQVPYKIFAMGCGRIRAETDHRTAITDTGFGRGSV